MHLSFKAVPELNRTHPIARRSAGGWSRLLAREGLVELPLQVGYLLRAHGSGLGQERF